MSINKKVNVFLSLLEDIRKASSPNLTGFSFQQWCEPRRRAHFPNRHSGCRKYVESCVVRQDLKNTEIAEIELKHPEEFHKLKNANCWRFKKEWCPTRLSQLPRIEPRTSNPNPFGCLELPSQPGGCGQCGEKEYRFRDCIPCECGGCVTPEMERDFSRNFKGSGGEEYWQSMDVCPYYYRYKGPGFNSKVKNQLRILQCLLTSAEFMKQQKRWGLFSVAQVYIDPAHISIFANEPIPLSPVYYMQKNPSAPIQYQTINPDSLSRDSIATLFPNHQVRFFAPKLARQYGSVDLKRALEIESVKETLKTFANFSHIPSLSPFERREGVLRVCDGELTYLRLKWILLKIMRYNDWSTSKVEAWVSKWDQAATWPIERDEEQSAESYSPQLLKKLRDIGLKRDLEQLFGEWIEDDRRPNQIPFLRTDSNTKAILRTASARDEFQFLGLLDRRKLSSLCSWLEIMMEDLKGHEPEYCDWRQMASDILLVDPNRTTDFKKFQQAVTKLKKMITSLPKSKKPEMTKRKILVFLTKIVLESTHNTTIGPHLELLESHFPSYPLVHHIMLAHLRVPIQWIAIPWGSCKLPFVKHQQNLVFPHGAFMLLMKEYFPDESDVFLKYLNQIKLTLGCIADREQNELGEEVSADKQLLNSISEAMETQLEHMSGGLFRVGEQTPQTGEDIQPKVLEYFRVHIGHIYIIQAVRALRMAIYGKEEEQDVLRILQELVADYNRVGDTYGFHINVNKDKYRTLVTSTRALLEIVIHNCIHNLLKYDVLGSLGNQQASPLNIHVVLEADTDQETIRIIFWNCQKLFDERADVFKDNPEAFKDSGKGLFICKSIMRWLGGDAHVMNREHPENKSTVGCVSLVLPLQSKGE